MKTLLRRMVFLFILTLIVPAFPIGLPKALAESVSQTDPNIVPGQVIVKYKRPPAVSRSLFSAQSISPVIHTLTFPQSTKVSDKIAQLKQDPNVEYAEPVYKVHINGKPPTATVTQSTYLVPSLTASIENWGMTVTQLTYASSITSPELCSRVVVAVVDTGIDLTHPDLKDSIVQGYDFVNNNTNPQDDNGHGTNVAGIIAAKAHGGDGYTGVAPGTKLMPIKVFNENGESTTATVIAGIQYAIDNKANIINLSLGSYSDSQALHDLIKQAVNSNILVVAAAGNDSDNWINNESGQLDNPHEDFVRTAHVANFPAIYDEVISVGAIEELNDGSSTVADFSNVLKVDVVAPGVSIYSTYLRGGYMYMDGTSQATPFVSGLAALIKANHPDITVGHLRSIIENSASKLPSLQLSYSNVNINGDPTLRNFDYYGHGLINGRNSFESASLHMIPDLSQLSGNTVTFTVYSEDIHGKIQANNSSQVLLTSYLDKEDSLHRIDPSLASGGTVVNLVNGVGKASLPETDLSLDAYYYKIFFRDTENRQIASNSIDLIKRPAAPVPNINSGSYEGAKTVTLTSATANADIYYAIDDGTTPVQLRKYSGPFTIDRSSWLTVYSLKNHVYSEFSVYNYTITPVTTKPRRGGGGGGGGGFPLPANPQPINPQPINSQPVDNGDNKTVFEVKPDHDALLQQMNAPGSTEVTIDAVTETKADTISVELPGDIIQKANENNRSLVIKMNEMNLTIPSNAFDVKDAAHSIQFKAEASNGPAPSMPQFARTAAPVYDFSLSVNGDPVEAFHTPLKAAFTYDAAKVQDPEKLGVFYFNEQTGIWNYVGGSLTGEGTITANLLHFSKYAVFEYRKTFEDIQTHWAKKEIEQLTLKQVIDGVTDKLFLPDSNVTRAQFVTLLSKALNLENNGGTASFKDVSNDSWYKDAVYAAYQANIVSGVGDGLFAPEANITREQMATMLVNAYVYATGKNLNEIAVTQEVKYADEGRISDWAKAQVRIASGLGLLNGMENGNFAPGENSSRAQAAAVINRLLNQLSQ